MWPSPVVATTGSHLPFCKRQIPNDHVPNCRETYQIQCNRPCDIATCHLRTAIWLGRSQSILTQVERFSESGYCVLQSLSSQPYVRVLACETWVPWMAVGPVWRTQCRQVSHHLREDAYGTLPGLWFLPGPPHQCWRRDALQPPEVLQLQLG